MSENNEAAGCGCILLMIVIALLAIVGFCTLLYFGGGWFVIGTVFGATMMLVVIAGLSRS